MNSLKNIKNSNETVEEDKVNNNIENVGDITLDSIKSLRRSRAKDKSLVTSLKIILKKPFHGTQKKKTKSNTNTTNTNNQSKLSLNQNKNSLDSSVSNSNNYDNNNNNNNTDNSIVELQSESDTNNNYNNCSTDNNVKPKIALEVKKKKSYKKDNKNSKKKNFLYKKLNIKRIFKKKKPKAYSAVEIIDSMSFNPIETNNEPMTLEINNDNKKYGDSNSKANKENEVDNIKSSIGVMTSNLPQSKISDSNYNSNSYVNGNNQSNMYSFGNISTLPMISGSDPIADSSPKQDEKNDVKLMDNNIPSDEGVIYQESNVNTNEINQIFDETLNIQEQENTNGMMIIANDDEYVENNIKIYCGLPDTSLESSQAVVEKVCQYFADNIACFWSIFPLNEPHQRMGNWKLGEFIDRWFRSNYENCIKEISSMISTPDQFLIERLLKFQLKSCSWTSHNNYLQYTLIRLCMEKEDDQHINLLLRSFIIPPHLWSRVSYFVAEILEFASGLYPDYDIIVSELTDSYDLVHRMNPVQLCLTAINMGTNIVPKRKRPSIFKNTVNKELYDHEYTLLELMACLVIENCMKKYCQTEIIKHLIDRYAPILTSITDSKNYNSLNLGTFSLKNELDSHYFSANGHQTTNPTDSLKIESNYPVNTTDDHVNDINKNEKDNIDYDNINDNDNDSGNNNTINNNGRNKSPHEIDNSNNNNNNTSINGQNNVNTNQTTNENMNSITNDNINIFNISDTNNNLYYNNPAYINSVSINQGNSTNNTSHDSSRNPIGIPMYLLHEQNSFDISNHCIDLESDSEDDTSCMTRPSLSIGFKGKEFENETIPLSLYEKYSQSISTTKTSQSYVPNYYPMEMNTPIENIYSIPNETLPMDNDEIPNNNNNAMDNNEMNNNEMDSNEMNNNEMDNNEINNNEMDNNENVINNNNITTTTIPTNDDNNNNNNNNNNSINQIKINPNSNITLTKVPSSSYISFNSYINNNNKDNGKGNDNDNDNGYLSKEKLNGLKQSKINPSYRQDEMIASIVPATVETILDEGVVDEIDVNINDKLLVRSNSRISHTSRQNDVNDYKIKNKNNDINNPISDVHPSISADCKPPLFVSKKRQKELDELEKIAQAATTSFDNTNSEKFDDKANDGESKENCHIIHQEANEESKEEEKESNENNDKESDEIIRENKKESGSGKQRMENQIESEIQTEHKIENQTENSLPKNDDNDDNDESHEKIIDNSVSYSERHSFRIKERQSLSSEYSQLRRSTRSINIDLNTKNHHQNEEPSLSRNESFDTINHYLYGSYNSSMRLYEDMEENEDESDFDRNTNYTSLGIKHHASEGLSIFDISNPCPSFYSYSLRMGKNSRPFSITTASLSSASSSCDNDDEEEDENNLHEYSFISVLSSQPSISLKDSMQNYNINSIDNNNNNRIVFHEIPSSSNNHKNTLSQSVRAQGGLVGIPVANDVTTGVNGIPDGLANSSFANTGIQDQDQSHLIINNSIANPIYSNELPIESIPSSDFDESNIYSSGLNHPNDYPVNNNNNNNSNGGINKNDDINDVTNNSIDISQNDYHSNINNNINNVNTIVDDKIDNDNNNNDINDDINDDINTSAIENENQNFDISTNSNNIFNMSSIINSQASIIKILRNNFNVNTKIRNEALLDAIHQVNPKLDEKTIKAIEMFDYYQNGTSIKEFYENYTMDHLNELEELLKFFNIFDLQLIQKDIINWVDLLISKQ